MSASVRTCLGIVALVALQAIAAPAVASDVFAPFESESVVEIATRDEDGAARDTKIWIVVLERVAYVRTNDSRWLANIRRGSPVSIRTAGAEGVERPVRASEVQDAAVKARVEEAFLGKYGAMQRVMSALRLREPTVLRLDPAPGA